ncbi:DegT/DnrJ/EryC1/StrS aminotransferase [Streptomyces ipomoeae]|jgi:dTDP-4-amino-4,6-dideoxygalactose transaminase|uniref:DegT/DnrJ/EryC1/StrS aminotransferase family protein n=2 Tax=Streptomyces ipomoeae TaxID=103232 RepID=L1KNT6_9ACTN|nr:DegT/DnrJ/EryC1/StrS family aminotransferase [Streptomyces ipomoeae]EKX62155.1 DegT/DnrJ/EryC1/StrS aminotransferase family protein [Streptomyces ipomoeae 91-03]MDX2695607.1 DegT/DnrJ/EryC1/StrS family aminotransferase [Streptomyces ipomoeae]MDX2828216.1 DegT/DnrJ/EryC1/StrS family aminotransferase [Streptomyces ipomoeae]MDX2841576.1 DegT/DnrJ/EryC1/StrS family aminotransferase [Streptomyces ipomoeae]MDX2875980.1 DegT/DnrJ/EryC1/StrS family aminotransferase [Streptomyces ipomoeae]
MLRAAGIGAGDEVIVPAFGNPEVAEAVSLAGAVPVFADIDPVTYCLDASAVEAVVTSRTVAIVVVHRFGRSADIARLRDVGQRHGLLVLEQGESETPYSEVGERRQRATYLSSKLKGVWTPDGGDGHTFQQYVVRVPGNGRPDRDAFARAIRAKGIECSVPVKTPVHRMPGFRRDVCLPETERAADETLALPIGGRMSRRELNRLVSACNALGGLLQPAF